MADKPVTTSYDLPVSEPLRQLMRTGWASPDQSVNLARAEVADFAAIRRQKLSAAFPGLRLVIPAGLFKVRNNDCDYRFRANTAFVHLTGMNAGDITPESVLVLNPTSDGHEALLYIHPRNDRNQETFYRDRRHGEFWVGSRLSIADAEKIYGIKVCDIKELKLLLDKKVESIAMRGEDNFLDQNIEMHARENDLIIALSELRLIKDDFEIKQMRKAVDATIKGFADIVKVLPHAVGHPRGERIIDAAFYGRARVEGNELGYDTIAASGAHACVLHWIRNDGVVKSGDLILIDAGVEVESHYTADITRTIPVNGKFSAAQRKIYELVLAAQSAGIAAVKPGAKYRDINNACMKVLAEGLYDLGVLTISAEESLKPENGLHRRWSVHASGHMLGLDVHDCAKARSDQYLDGVLQVGQVLTVEPGLYIQPDDQLFPAEYRGIGVRIEDDLLVTESGSENLSVNLPRTVSEIENWIVELQK
ncbi:Xaa-Pro aminopeptidase 1 [Actinomycetes bacterium]|nr:Xaa-Pro aminopeptidase 1 [Actinomycetes bacterium]